MADLLMKMPVPYEPKRKNRFILKFPSDLGIAEWIVSFLTNGNFGDLDYSGDDLADVSATLRFDRAILKY